MVHIDISKIGRQSAAEKDMKHNPAELPVLKSSTYIRAPEESPSVIRTFFSFLPSTCLTLFLDHFKHKL